jgi:hypothetical protein
MHEVKPRMGVPEMLKPAEQLGLAGMRRKSAKRVNGRADRNLITAYAKKLRAIHQRPPRCADRLEADNYDMRIGFPKIVFEVMPYTTAVTHPATSDKNSPGFNPVQCHGLGCGRGIAEDRQEGMQAAAFTTLNRLRVFGIVDMLVAVIDFGDSNGHRTIQVDSLLPQLALLVQLP